MLERAERHKRGRELSASWCNDALMGQPNHLFRRMWAARSWAPMETGAPACWDRKRDAPHRRLKPLTFFQQAENGTFCRTNWYEGHANELGEPGRLPPFASPAPALLGYDDGIFEYCAAALPAGHKSCRRDRPGHVARCCLAAGYNILNMVGHRVPYNLCRNMEWQLCAVLGRLPGQALKDRSIRFANAPRSLDVEPLTHRRSGGAGHQARKCNERKTLPKSGAEASDVAPSVAASLNGYGVKRLGYSLPDIFHLEVCFFNQVCTNGPALFELKVGEPFICQFSHERFAALSDLLLRTAGPLPDC